VWGWGSSYGQRVSVAGQHRDSAVLIQSSAQIGIQVEQKPVQYLPLSKTSTSTK
jgi:hypothetical protein